VLNRHSATPTRQEPLVAGKANYTKIKKRPEKKRKMKFLSTILSSFVATILFQGALSSSALRGNVEEIKKATPFKDVESLKARIKQYRALLKNYSQVDAPENDRSLHKANNCPSILKKAKKTTLFGACFAEEAWVASFECVFTSYETGSVVGVVIGSVSTGQSSLTSISGQWFFPPDNILVDSPSAPLEAPAPSSDSYLISAQLSGFIFTDDPIATPLQLGVPYTVPFGRNLCGANKFKFIETLYLGDNEGGIFFNGTIF